MKLPVFYLGIFKISDKTVYAEYPKLMKTDDNQWRPYDMSQRYCNSLQSAATFIWQLKEDEHNHYRSLPVYFVPTSNNEDTVMVTDKETMIELVLKYS